jgi:hypothetical protein
MIAKMIAAMGRSMKSSGVFTRAIAERSFTSMILPSTMPSTIGTTGRSSRFRM